MSRTVTSSWYLDQVVAPNGEEITLKYTSPSVNGIRRALSKSEHRTHSLGVTYISNRPGCMPDCGPLQHTYFRSLSIAYEVYLEEINFRNGKIKFRTADRDDMQCYQYPSYSIAKPKRLSQIDIYKKSGTTEELIKHLNSDRLILPIQLFLRLIIRIKDCDLKVCRKLMEKLKSNPMFLNIINLLICMGKKFLLKTPGRRITGAILTLRLITLS